MDEVRKKFLGMITQEKCLYYKANFYYPEILFVTLTINDFTYLCSRKKTKSSPFPLLDKRNLWDTHIAHARLFQSLVINCLKDAVTEASFKRMLNLMHKDFPWTDGYATQYLDLLNIRYLDKAGTTGERERSTSTDANRHDR